MSVAPPRLKQYLNIEEAVNYLRSLGFATATVDTIRTAAYRTGKLPRPKKIGRLAYWAKADLDAFVEKL